MKSGGLTRRRFFALHLLTKRFFHPKPVATFRFSKFKTDYYHIRRTSVLLSNRRTIMGSSISSSLFGGGGGDGNPPENIDPELKRRAEEDPRSLTDTEWKSLLSPQQFHVTRHSGTEPSFTGDLWDCKDDGNYLCVCCSAELFRSGAKFESGSGWPSFYEPEKKGLNVEEKRDASHGMIRTEVNCKRCGSHLGHVFNDGPNPTGLRYCINSASLKFVKKS